MIKVSVLYPNTPGIKFDWQYYLEKHAKLVKDRLGNAIKSIQIDKGVSGPQPGTSASFHAMAHMSFNSMEEFANVFQSHAQEIMGDIPNYTNVQPQIQISEVIV